MRTNLSLINSALFVPASAPEIIAKALASAADAVIVDLEDAVIEPQKAQARALAASALSASERPWRAVRVNPPTSTHAREDLLMAGTVGVDAIVLPKASVATVDSLGAEGPAIWALVETAEGLHGAYELALRPRVELLLLGTLDLALDLDLKVGEQQAELAHARASIVLDSRAAGLRAPLDGVCARLRDRDLLEWEARLARAMGFGGKLCVHPEQLDVVRAAFAVNETELVWARDALAAYEAASRSGLGATTLDGELVDKPVAERARRLLQTTGELS